MEDYLLNGQVHGKVASQLQGMTINELRTNAVLRHEEWKEYDKTVIEISRNRLVGVADLISRGLVYRPGNGLGSTVLQYEDMSDLEDATMSMDGLTQGNNDRVEYSINYLPLPITHKDFQINGRVLRASRTNGSPLDTTQAGIAARKVSEKLESTLFNGSGSYAYGGGTIYGYTDAPSRNTYDLGGAWTSRTGAQILTDVLAMIQLSIDALHFGPWNLYVPTAYQTQLAEDYKDESDITIRERLLEIDGLQEVKVADQLSSGNVVLVQMTSDVVRMVEAFPLANIEWQTQGKMLHHFKVMTVNVPQIRSDQDSNSGIVHGSV